MLLGTALLGPDKQKNRKMAIMAMNGTICMMMSPEPAAPADCAKAGVASM
jgi:hypothetical protein